MAVDESSLTRMQLRKLNALRKSVGDKIGEAAFEQWLADQPERGAAADPNIGKISELLETPVLKGDIKLPKSGYLVRRGRGRVIVEPNVASRDVTREPTRAKRTPPAGTKRGRSKAAGKRTRKKT